MKKIFALLLAASMVLALAACSNSGSSASSSEDPTKKGEGVMTYAEYDAAAIDDAVVVETYVQAKQGWWENDGQGCATLYTQDGDGAYFIYNANVSQDDYNKLVDGQKIKVTGYKSEWSGEVEIIDATIEVEDGNWIAEATDVTSKYGSDDLIKDQNKKITIKNATVASAPIYNWDGSGSQGDDIYFDIDVNGATYTVTLESYLTGADTDVYKTAEGLTEGTVVDLEGFLYWYEGAQPHITAITTK